MNFFYSNDLFTLLKKRVFFFLSLFLLTTWPIWPLPFFSPSLSSPSLGLADPPPPSLSLTASQDPTVRTNPYIRPPSFRTVVHHPATSPPPRPLASPNPMFSALVYLHYHRHSLTSSFRFPNIFMPTIATTIYAIDGRSSRSAPSPTASSPRSLGL